MNLKSKPIDDISDEIDDLRILSRLALGIDSKTFYDFLFDVPYNYFMEILCYDKDYLEPFWEDEKFD